MIQRIEVPYTHRFAEMVRILDDTGLLLAASKRSGESNVMTIGWGMVGVVWGLPIFAVLVRPSRFTYQFIEDSGEFTVNVPSPELRRFVDFCGSHSGREVDKFAQFHIATSPGRRVSSVTIDACPWVYECRVVQKNDVLPETLAPKIISAYYPRGDLHRVFYGEILGVFAAE
ncbi:MAG: flavin reductase family protein [Anaerolineae bacterium]|nr:flavin reductase family protein [Anaerolineae bacterium]